jgi:peptide/nickel transport system substrate-binding protein
MMLNSLLRRAVALTLGLSLGLGTVMAIALPTSVHAKTFRWTDQGDANTMDPHAQNELLTNAINGQVYETLVNRDKQMKVKAVLATEWQQTGPKQWQVKLRRNVKFHDGSAFTAEDVVFSVKRAQENTSAIKSYALGLGEPRKMDDFTVEFNLKDVNPIFLEHATLIQIMSKAWCEKNNSAKPQDFKNKQETHTALNANGTGPYVLKTRQPDVRTVHTLNPNYWGKVEGNVTEVIFTPLKSDPTRTAALLSNEVDFLHDPATNDVQKLRSSPNVKVIDGMENRVLFIGMDQSRDELLYSDVKGKNPFKDRRVRQALYQAIDIEAIKTRLMRNQAFPTGAIMPSPLGTYNDPDIEKRRAFDVAEAKRLMTEAGYPNGFSVQLDCPNNRYINDEEICSSLANMWAQLGMKIKVLAMPRGPFFAKGQKRDVSMYLLGWGGAITDGQTTFDQIYHSKTASGKGDWNWGDVKNPTIDALEEQQAQEADPKKREVIVRKLLKEMNEQVHYLPLHRQVIPWAARSNVDVVHRPDNWLEYQWITVR